MSDCKADRILLFFIAFAPFPYKIRLGAYSIPYLINLFPRLEFKTFFSKIICFFKTDFNSQPLWALLFPLCFSSISSSYSNIWQKICCFSYLALKNSPLRQLSSLSNRDLLHNNIIFHRHFLITSLSYSSLCLFCILQWPPPGNFPTRPELSCASTCTAIGAIAQKTNTLLFSFFAS